MRIPLLSVAAAALVLGCSSDATGNDPDPLPAPSNIQAAIVNDNVVLTWDSVPGAESYRVYMAAEPGVQKSNLQQLLENMLHAEADLAFNHPPGLQASVQYYFVVTALGPDGESEESCEVSARISTNSPGSC
jgi:hypothetical protein